MKRFKPLFAASLLALALCSPGLAAVTRYKVHIYDQNGNNVNCSTGTTIASIILQPHGAAAGAVGTSNTISTITVSASGTPTTLTTSTTSATVIADNAGNIWFDLDPEVVGDCTIIFGTITKSGITFSGSPPQVDCLREPSRILSGFSSSGAVTLASSQSFNNTGQVANLPANVAQVAGQTASAAGTVTFPGTISSYAGADTSGTTTLLTRVGQNLLFDGSGNLKADLVAYTPSAGSVTTLGSSFALPNGTVSSYAGGDTSGVTTLLSRIGSALTISGGKVAATIGTGDDADSSILLARLTSLRAGYLDNLATAPPSLSAIIAGLWQDTTSYSAGSKGAALASAASAGDPWSTTLPGSYSAGTAGYLVGTYLNASVAAVKAKTDLLTTFPANFSSLVINNATGGIQIDLAQALDPSKTGDVVGGGLIAARAQGFGKWVITGTVGSSGSTLKLYAADNVTVLKTFDMSSAKSRL